MVVQNMQEARSLAERHLGELPLSPPMELAILDGNTMEADFGWVFFWNSKQYQKTGDALAGNAPLIVDRRDGSVHATSTAEPIEDAIERYRKATPLYSEPGTVPEVYGPTRC